MRSAHPGCYIRCPKRLPAPLRACARPCSVSSSWNVARTDFDRFVLNRYRTSAHVRPVLCYAFPCRSFFLSSFVAESIARTTFLLPERGDAAEAGCRRGHLMKRPGSAACHAADIVGRGIRSERLCYAAAKRLTGTNGDRGGHPDEAALHPDGETANASKPLKITVEAAIRRPQLRRLGLGLPLPLRSFAMS